MEGSRGGVMSRVGVDVGGTFTDIVWVDDDAFESRVEKVRSTPWSIGQAVLDAIDKIGVDLGGTTLFVHGTTAGINAIAQRKGSKVGLITTKGFEDVLEMGRGNRKELYNYLWKKPDPLVPRHLRLGLDERTSYLGEILRPVREEEVVKIIGTFKRKGVEAVAICLLHAYANPENERTVGRMIRELWPGVPISLSHRISLELREFERTSTTVVDAYIKKSVVEYLDLLAQGLRQRGFAGRIYVIGHDGIAGVEEVKERAILSVKSGPMGGVAGSILFSKLMGRRNLITMDVGGTTFDVSLIKDGLSVEKQESEALGYPLLLRGPDIRSIGAGGGSIAWVDPGGLLMVGPRSAGAFPGPMCYGLGGEEPTVTDACVVNGIIDPHYFLGGEVELDADLAAKGLERLSAKLRLGLHEVASGILEVARSNMMMAMREILLGQGFDPRDFFIISFGGAGGIFACHMARELNARGVIVPQNPGVFSAWGMLTMDLVYSYTRTFYRSLHEADMELMEEMFAEMENEGVQRAKRDGIEEKEIVVNRAFDMCYEGQAHYVEVPFRAGRTKGAKEHIEASFHALHEAKYGHRLEDVPFIVNLKVKVVGKIKEMPLKQLQRSRLGSPERKGRRRVFLGRESVECPVYERRTLLFGDRIGGPAIVEEPFHTTLVPQGHMLEVDEFGNLIIVSEVDHGIP